MKDIGIERSEWQKPEYLGHYDEGANYYEGIRCRCNNCGDSFVFSAKEQKIEFEMNKKYPGWLPLLCNQCSEIWERITTSIVQLETKLEGDKKKMLLDSKFLEELLHLYKRAHDFNIKDFQSKVNHIKKLL